MNSRNSKSKLYTLAARFSRPFLRDCLWRVNTSRKELYFTFDDGPEPESTPLILDILDKHSAQATFFLIGSKAQKYPMLVKDILDRGHEIGNHSFNHRDPWKLSKEDLIASFERSQKQINLQLSDARDSLSPSIANISIRPPFGHLTKTLRKWAKENDSLAVMWDLDPCDYLQNTTPKAISQAILTDAKPGSIILMHDRADLVENTTQALEEVLTTLSKDGWNFLSTGIARLHHRA